MKDFMVVLKASKEGKSLNMIEKENGGGLGRHKARRIKCCLAEARRHQQRRFLATARAITLHVDGRHGRLLVLWTAAGQDFTVLNLACGPSSCDASTACKAFWLRISVRNLRLRMLILSVMGLHWNAKVRRGILGHGFYARSTSSGASTYGETIIDIVKTFCTAFHGAPDTSGRKHKNKFARVVEILLDTLRNRTVVLSSDAASGMKAVRPTLSILGHHLLGMCQVQQWALSACDTRVIPLLDYVRMLGPVRVTAFNFIVVARCSGAKLNG